MPPTHSAAIVCALSRRDRPFSLELRSSNIELVPNQCIVQAWRPAAWDPGIYSLVKFELKPRNSATTIVLDHSSYPEGDFAHLEWGWNAHYWQPLKKLFHSR
jgi:hypothetical protein